MRKPKAIYIRGNKISCGIPSFGLKGDYWIEFEYKPDYDRFAFLVNKEEANKLVEFFQQLKEKLTEIEYYDKR